MLAKSTHIRELQVNIAVEPSQLMHIAHMTAKRWARTYDEVDDYAGDILLKMVERVDKINAADNPVKFCWVLARHRAQTMWLDRINRQRITGFMADIDNVMPSDGGQCIVEADMRLCLIEILRTAPPVTMIAIKKKLEGVPLDTTERVSLMRWRKQHQQDLRELVA